MSLKVIHTTGAPAAVGPYSQAIQAGNMVFVSGQIPLDPATGKRVEGGIKAETERCLLNAKAILEEAGLTFNDVAKTTCLLDSMDDFAAMNEVYASFFVDHKPARAAFEVGKLPLGVLVEIEMIAYKK
ncbi:MULTISPECIES: RidA family protein [unclassified Fusibacter]|uniref:RidA family protein n=1 Tax=unclassified Fusibacter TaxID=2624464 RepID=UPI0010125067|nr:MULTISPECIES: RidA family protein [unclassified Fusibacter]MCK8060689.1 RidA family protein [Fusibacter sp. A2]NPE22857.1 RidA family protein [Fusibacter sp. A1]RXV59926.1 RidA family protein [Fusibacter sp. A1]